jgi:phosphoribosylformylglycinamidine (FGAM) synthase PurS component
MKKVTVLAIAMTALMFSCNQSSDKEVKEAKEKLTEAKNDVKDAQADVKNAQANEMEAARVKEVTDWKYFKSEADSSIASFENGLKDMKVKIEKAGKKDKQKLTTEFNKAKGDMDALKDKLQQRSVEFDNSMASFNQNVSERNQSFKREFNHDMYELGKSLKDLFKDNVK